MAASQAEAAPPSGTFIMRTTRTITITITALAALTLAGCSNPDPVTPTPISRAGGPAEAVDVGHLPELTAPATCSGHVALTFDDGPTELTSELLATLEHYDVPAAFFNVGTQEKTFPRLVELQIEAGHQVGNHTMTHPDLSTLSLQEAMAEVDAATAVQQSFGRDDLTLFRPPFGGTTPEIREAVESRGMTEVLWTVDSKDYEAASVEQVVEASKGMTDGGILLLHEGKPMTVEAVPQIIEHYYDQGLCFGQVTTADTELPANLGITHRARASEQEATS